MSAIRRRSLPTFPVIIVGLALLASPAWNRSLEDEQIDPCQGEEIACISCVIFCRYGDVLDEAQVDIGAIPDGIIIHYTTENPVRVVDLQRYAYERKKLFGGLGDEETLNRLCEKCRHKAMQIESADFEVANSAHGVFAVLTSTDSNVVEVLHQMAAEMTLNNDVRGS